LKPGGKVCVLEITLPKGKIAITLLKLYMKMIVPLMARLTTRHTETALLFRYHWDTIQACVSPETVFHVLAAEGFEQVKRHVVMGIFSEYTASKPS
jgi:demethylmenaquinone methyltransferase/2-methoxy-6-polyprenyl-1,4-benzoquinol methylase